VLGHEDLADQGLLGLPHEDVWLTAEDGVRIHGWYLPVPRARWVTLVSHGNAGNISHRLDRALFLQARLRSSVFLYDYRGYGASEGSPDEAGTYRDARAAYRYLVDEEKQVKRTSSCSSASRWSASLELALDRRPPRSCSRRSFTSVRDVARRRSAPSPFVRTRYESLARISRLRMPLLVVQGDRDEVIPPAQGRRLFDAAPEPKRYFAIPGAGHNDTYLVGGEAYWRTIADFLETVGPGTVAER
jgi:fermentation-respiration switch protein FrsA (DUF1100 family)